MPSDAEIKAKFWKALKSDMTLMLGLDGGRRPPQPMTAQIEGDEGGPIWFFAASDNSLIDALGAVAPAIATFADKGHGLFASIPATGRRHRPRRDRRLWNPFVAAWYEGKDDPKLAPAALRPGERQDLAQRDDPRRRGGGCRPRSEGELQGEGRQGGL